MKVGIVVLDTLRWDTARQEFESLRDQAKHRFQNQFSTSRWTVPAHASLFTGIYPTEVGTHADHRYLTSAGPTIAEQFQLEGFQTVALSNNVHIDSYFDFDQGFETLYRGPTLRGRPSESDSDFDWDELFSTIGHGPLRYPRALKKIVTSDAPTIPTLKTGIEMLRSTAVNAESDTIDWAFEGIDETITEYPDDLFFFANLMPTHFPYRPPAGYSDVDPLDTPPFHLTLRDEPVTDEEHRRHLENYRAAARYLDDELPKLIDRVDWDCLFVISDHGELFGEDGLYGHEYGVHENLVHVPAFAVGSEVPEGTTEAVTSILDVHRTLLDIAGIEPPEHARGRNLFEDDFDDDRAVYAESTGVGQYSPDAKGILANIPAEWDEEHYMIRTQDAMFVSDADGERAIDPETGEGLPEREAELRDRAAEIRAERQTYSDDGPSKQVEDAPEEIQDRLEHLGYK